MPAPHPHPSLLDRPWTDTVEHPPDDEHPTGYRTISTKTCCTGCGAMLGDMNEAEVAAAICGFAMPDNRHECRTCAPGAPAPLAVNDRLDPALAEGAHLTPYLGGWERADGVMYVEAMSLDWVVVRCEDSGRPLLLKVSPDVARAMRP